MRSLKYLLGGRPANTDDCVDHAYQHKVDRIILTLLTPEEATEQWTVRWLKVSMVWFFDDLTATYEQVLGGCFRHEAAHRQKISLDNANTRLEHDLLSIRSRLGDVCIEGEQQRFQPSAMYTS